MLVSSQAQVALSRIEGHFFQPSVVEAGSCALPRLGPYSVQTPVTPALVSGKSDLTSSP